MITKLYDSLTSFLLNLNSATRVGQLVINNAAAETSILLQQIDLAKVQNLGDVASLELEILTGNVAPAANQSVTMWAAFCSNGSKQPIELSTAASSQVCPLATIAGTRRRYMAPLYYMGAQYLYIWYDHTALPAGCVLTLNQIVNGKRS